eukprot:Rmarinus@m.16253
MGGAVSHPSGPSDKKESKYVKSRLISEESDEEPLGPQDVLKKFEFDPDASLARRAGSNRRIVTGAPSALDLSGPRQSGFDASDTDTDTDALNYITQAHVPSPHGITPLPGAGVRGNVSDGRPTKLADWPLEVEETIEGGGELLPRQGGAAPSWRTRSAPTSLFVDKGWIDGTRPRARTPPTLRGGVRAASPLAPAASLSISGGGFAFGRAMKQQQAHGATLQELLETIEHLKTQLVHSQTDVSLLRAELHAMKLTQGDGVFGATSRPDSRVSALTTSNVEAHTRATSASASGTATGRKKQFGLFEPFPPPAALGDSELSDSDTSSKSDQSSDRDGSEMSSNSASADEARKSTEVSSRSIPKAEETFSGDEGPGEDGAARVTDSGAAAGTEPEVMSSSPNKGDCGPNVPAGGVARHDEGSNDDDGLIDGGGGKDADAVCKDSNDEVGDGAVDEAAPYNTDTDVKGDAGGGVGDDPDDGDGADVDADGGDDNDDVNDDAAAGGGNDPPVRERQASVGLDVPYIPSQTRSRERSLRASIEADTVLENVREGSAAGRTTKPARVDRKNESSKRDTVEKETVGRGGRPRKREKKRSARDRERREGKRGEKRRTAADREDSGFVVSPRKGMLNAMRNELEKLHMHLVSERERSVRMMRMLQIAEEETDKWRSRALASNIGDEVKELFQVEETMVEVGDLVLTELLTEFRKRLDFDIRRLRTTWDEFLAQTQSAEETPKKAGKNPLAFFIRDKKADVPDVAQELADVYDDCINAIHRTMLLHDRSLKNLRSSMLDRKIRAQKVIDNTSDQLSKYEKEISKSQESFSKMENWKNELNQRLEQKVQETTKYQHGMVRAQEAFEETRLELRTKTMQINELNDVIRALRKAGETMKKETLEANRTAKECTAALAEKEKELAQLQNTLSEKEDRIASLGVKESALQKEVELTLAKERKRLHAEVMKETQRQMSSELFRARSLDQECKQLAKAYREEKDNSSYLSMEMQKIRDEFDDVSERFHILSMEYTKLETANEILLAHVDDTHRRLSLEDGPVEQETLRRYAHHLGLDSSDPTDQKLMWIVREAIYGPLPETWSAYRDNNNIPYFTSDAHDTSTYKSPLDPYCRQLIFEFGQCIPGSQVDVVLDRKYIGSAPQTQRSSPRAKSKSSLASGTAQAQIARALGPMLIGAHEPTRRDSIVADVAGSTGATVNDSAQPWESMGVEHQVAAGAGVEPITARSGYSILSRSTFSSTHAPRRGENSYQGTTSPKAREHADPTKPDTGGTDSKPLSYPMDTTPVGDTLAGESVGDEVLSSVGPGGGEGLRVADDDGGEGSSRDVSHEASKVATAVGSEPNTNDVAADVGGDVRRDLVSDVQRV